MNIFQNYRLFFSILCVGLFCAGNLWATDKIIRVAAFNYYPSIYKDANDVIKGVFPDWLEIMAKENHWKIEYVFGSWAEGLERAQKGEIDLITSAAMTKERKAFLDYAEEDSLLVWGEVYVRNSADVSSLLELQKKTIAVMRKDFNASAFKTMVDSFNLECYFQEFADYPQVLEAIRTGIVDAGVINSSVGNAEAHLYGLKSSGVVFNPFSIYFAQSKKSKQQEVLSIINSTLKEWKKNKGSPYFLSIERWLKRRLDVRFRENLYYQKIALVVLGLFFLAALFAILLRREVTKQTKEIEENRQKVEIANRAKTIFLLQMGHELRTPLNAMLGFTEELISEYKREHNGKAPLYSGRLLRAQSYFQNTVESILNVSNLESDVLISKKEVISIRGFLDEILSHSSILLEGRELEFFLKVSQEVPDVIWEDSRHLRQIIISVLSNCINFSEKGIIEIRLFMVKDRLYFEVQDSGVGICDDEKKLFLDLFNDTEKDYFHSVMTCKYKGSALGLFLTKKLLDHMSGEILVQTSANHGCVFSFYIPVSEPSDEFLVDVEKETDIPARRLQGRILYVDDDIDNRELVKVFLRDENVSLDLAVNGKEALDKIEHNVYDLILLDLQMPVLDGLTACKRIREQEKIAQENPKKIIAFSAHAYDEDIQLCFDAGFDGHVAKPIRKQALLSEITKYISLS